MNYTPVKSSQIKEIAYDAENSIIWVRFKSKTKPYSYGPFTKEQYDELLNADSVGKHFYSTIRPNNVDLEVCEGCDKLVDITTMFQEPKKMTWFCPTCNDKFNS